MPVDSWPDDQVEELKRLHDKGLSSAEVARELNLKFRTEHSRNAVIGKKARLGLSVPIGPRTPRMKSAQDRVLKARIVRPRPAPQVFACDETGLRVADVVPLNISIDDLTDDTCRWPYGERPVVYCGLQSLEGLPYCADHFVLSCRETDRGIFERSAAYRALHRKILRPNVMSLNREYGDEDAA